MKKLVLLLLVALLALTSCANESANGTDAGSYKVGSYAYTEPAKLGEGDNGKTAQMNTTLATVVLDKDGKIVEVYIDVAQNTVALKDGTVTVPTETPTKKEKGDANGMKKASKIGKEWHEQIDALEKELVGKNLEEVKGIEVKDNLLTDEELLASVSVKVTGYLTAVTKAMENAVAVEGKVAKVGSTSVTKISDKATDNGGDVTFNTNFGHVALDADGKVLLAYVDVAQNKVSYDKEGNFAEHTPLESKKIIKENYGLVKASSIKKEWFEQAAALEEFFKGKTVEEITGIETDEAGVPTISELTSSVTVKINDYKEIVKRAAEDAIDVAQVK